NMTADKLIKLNLIDSIVPEPLGGAHRDYTAIATSLKAQLLADLNELEGLALPELLERRFQRLMNYGYVR
ncbi:hypothetical protein GASC598P17_002520, partial [Gilliamella apis SCGC AB-598-P17]